MVKVCIGEKRKYEFVGKEGDKISGFSYGGFLENGTAITFTSRRDYPVGETLGYEPGEAVELDIRPKFWGGTVKYREVYEGK